MLDNDDRLSNRSTGSAREGDQRFSGRATVGDEQDVVGEPAACVAGLAPRGKVISDPALQSLQIVLGRRQVVTVFGLNDGVAVPLRRSAVC